MIASSAALMAMSLVAGPPATYHQTTSPLPPPSVWVQPVPSASVATRPAARPIPIAWPRSSSTQVHSAHFGNKRHIVGQPLGQSVARTTPPPRVCATDPNGLGCYRTPFAFYYDARIPEPKAFSYRNSQYEREVDDVRNFPKFGFLPGDRVGQLETLPSYPDRVDNFFRIQF